MNTRFEKIRPNPDQSLLARDSAAYNLGRWRSKSQV
jgi:hypothetical protein